MSLSSDPGQPVPRFEDEAAGAVFAELTLLFFFEDAEGFVAEVMAMKVGY